MKSLISSLLVILLAACAIAPKPDSPQSQALQEKFADNPDHLINLTRLFAQQIVEVEQYPGAYTLQQAIATGEKLAKAQQDQDETLYKLYQLKRSLYMGAPSDSNFAGVLSFFNEHPQLKYFSVVPPHLLRVNRSFDGQQPVDEKQVIQWLKKAVNEVPKHSGSKRFLAYFYLDTDAPWLAAYLLEQSLQYDPENNEIKKALAQAKDATFFAAACLRSDLPGLAENISRYKALIKTDPKDFESQLGLASLYQMKGQKRLFLYTLQQLVKQKPSYQPYLVEAILWNHKPQQALDYISDKKLEDQDSYYEKIYAYLMMKNWAAVAKLAANIAQDDEPSAFAIVYVAQAIAATQSDAAAQVFLSEQASRYKPSDWKNTLYQYAQGGLTNQQLLQSAKNKCEATEAHFTLAYQALLQGSPQQAKMHLDYIQQANIHAYYEHATGSYWLSRLSD